MRVTVSHRELEVAPGATASLVVDVVNNDAVIDGVSARVIGLPEESVRVEPALLPLFPDATGQVTLTFAVPRSLPAGRHSLVVEVVSHGAHAPTSHVDFDLLVEARPELRLSARPRIARGRRGGRFVLEVANPGNVRMQVDLDATDPNRVLAYRFSQSSFALDPGASAPVLLNVRAPRRVTGGDLDRNVSVTADARRLDLPPDTIDASGGPDQEIASVQLRQRPLISRGLLTALILAGIVGLWAGAFLLGLSKVFSQDPLTKQAPASFFALTKNPKTGAVNVDYNIADAAPFGALPKSGELPTGVGSQITGTVLGVSDHQPVGRILVQAIRMRRGAPLVVSSAGTQSDGTYTLAGLFPMNYLLKFSAPGFHTTYYSGGATGVTSLGAARAIQTAIQGSTTVTSILIKGKPATISGGVDPGDTLTPVTTTVTARPLQGGAGLPTRTATTDATNTYHLRDLPAPATYELTFTAKGYASTVIVETVSGGDNRLEPVVTLSAGQGQISGFVRDDNGTAIGNATVSTTVNGAPLTILTPTAGAVGSYTLDHLPTPATYVVTFSAPGHGTTTRIVDLGVGPQAVRSNFDTSLIAGTASITGSVIGPDGEGLGGVTVTVGGSSPGAPGALPPSTTTLTNGAKGSFAINGLAAPGSYTLTAQLAGYQSATVPITLDGRSRPKSVKIILSKNAGSIGGRVSGPCPQAACAGAIVTATNGQQVWTTAVSRADHDLPKGGYLITGLPAGTYSVTVTDTGMSQQTAIVLVHDNKRSPQDLTLGA